MVQSHAFLPKDASQVRLWILKEKQPMQQALMVRTTHIYNLTNLAPQDNSPIVQVANFLMTEKHKHYRIGY